MTDPVQQGKINDAAWKMCDIFRGVMDANDYKDYILTMLFLKYISDVWKDKVAELERKYKGDTARISRAKRNERFQLPKGASFYDLYANRRESNIGERINKALEDLESANKTKLESVFRNIDFNSPSHLGDTKDRNRRLCELLETFNTPDLDLSPSRVSEDIIGNTYIYLIDQFAAGAGKKAGEYYTPYMVSRLVARLCSPTKGARICDPACGSGSLLIEAARVVQKTKSRNYSLYGMEVNGGTWALCRMNMFLHQFDSADIRWCNTLTEPKLADGNKLMQFDYLVSNPPFSLKNWGAEAVADDRYNRFYRGVPPKSKGDFAFISHMVEAATARKGRVAVVVPHGVLFRGASEGNIRQKLVDENLLDAVVGLPGNLFQTTSIPVAILVFDRSREKGGANAKRKDVLFIDASRDYEPGKKQNALLDEHLDAIMKVYEAAERKDVPKYARWVSLDEIKENDYNLNIPRYVDTYEEEEEIDIGETKKEIRRLEKDLQKTRDRMDILLKEIGV